MKLLPVSGAILNFEVKESTVKVSIGTVEKLILENMDIAFVILSLGGTEPEIPPTCNVYVLKHCNTGSSPVVHIVSLIV